MAFARTLDLPALRQSLANHRLEEQQLRELIRTSASSTVRMLAGIDLVDVSKKIEAEMERIAVLESEQAHAVTG